MMAQPPRNTTDQILGKIEDTVGYPRGIHQLAGEHEKGNRQQGKTAHGKTQLLRGDRQGEIICQEEDEGGDTERERDRIAKKNEHQTCDDNA